MRLSLGWLLAFAFVASAATQEWRVSTRTVGSGVTFEADRALPSWGAHTPTAVLLVAGSDRPSTERPAAGAVPGTAPKPASTRPETPRAPAARASDVSRQPVQGRAPPSAR